MDENAKSYLADLILHSLDDEKNIGIKDGVMGKIIRMLDASVSYEEVRPTLLQIAEILLCRIISRFPTTDNVYDFETGLCGVAWGIEYLANRSFIENSPTEILSEFNDRIQAVSVSTLTEGELRGLIRYTAAHIYNCQKDRQSSALSNEFLRSISEETQIRDYNYSETDLQDVSILRHALTGNPLPEYIFNTSLISV